MGGLAHFFTASQRIKSLTLILSPLEILNKWNIFSKEKEGKETSKRWGRRGGRRQGKKGGRRGGKNRFVNNRDCQGLHLLHQRFFSHSKCFSIPFPGILSLRITPTVLRCFIRRKKINRRISLVLITGTFPLVSLELPSWRRTLAGDSPTSPYMGRGEGVFLFLVIRQWFWRSEDSDLG